jgi:pyruvate dehydrogenase E1 component alpha subunit
MHQNYRTSSLSPSKAVELYQLMVRSRKFEEATQRLWDAGKIFGELHMGTGEEAIVAAIITNLQEGDAIAADHRGTPPFFMRGVDPVALLLEFMGHPQGLCAGSGGHMHLFSQPHLMSSSGIVGSSGPAAVGYALAHQYRKNPNIAVAFFGEGSLNQGMMMEALNLAATWQLPVFFVCKDNNWAITTPSSDVTGGNLADKINGFGIDYAEVDGLDLDSFYPLVSEQIALMRHKPKPFFLHAHCVHTEAHFLGDPLVRFHRDTLKAFGAVTGPLMKAVLQVKGGGFTSRTKSLLRIFSLIGKSGDQLKAKRDPLEVFRSKHPDIEAGEYDKIGREAEQEITAIVAKVTQIVQGGKLQ